MQLGDARYRVVINHEEQYSIWPADQPPPEGFEPRGGECRPRDCAESIASAGGRPERPR
ncbi:MAG: MbtH family protein [Acidobacteria bacterium]|nr:MAG: MbtH family protein [Acidobacteriota bacterium]REK00517.1 MAG: MbtH family protein [Acidobacteriota bacterium]